MGPRQRRRRSYSKEKAEVITYFLLLLQEKRIKKNVAEIGNSTFNAFDFVFYREKKCQ